MLWLDFLQITTDWNNKNKTDGLSVHRSFTIFR